MDLKKTYFGKTVLVTGHMGFKGGWLSLWLHHMGANVIGYSTPPTTTPSFYQAVQLHKYINDVRGDVENIDELESVLSTYKPDFIFHLAAQPIVRKSYCDPLETIRTNVMGTVNVLESIRSTNLKTTCVCITSDKCYKNQEWDYAYRENDQLGGHDPYSASKAAAEMLISAYADSFFKDKSSNCALSSARAGNVIGGGDWSEDRIVSDCIRSLSEQKKIIIRNPISIRPWQYVLDVLCGYLTLGAKMYINKEKYSGAWNFGPYPKNNIDVDTLVSYIIDAWGVGESYAADNIEDRHESTYLKLDSTKSMSLLKWEPKYDIFDTVDKTVSWYKHYYADDINMKDYSIYQIEKHMGYLPKPLSQFAS